MLKSTNASFADSWISNPILINFINPVYESFPDSQISEIMDVSISYSQYVCIITFLYKNIFEINIFD